VRYGLRQEARYKDNPKWTESSKTEPKKIVVPRLCYDAATAWETIKAQGRGVLPVFAICGSGKDSPLSARPFDLTGPRHVSDMVLVSRSPFAIFQYLGRILASNSMDRVLLHPHLRDLNLGDPHVLNIQAGGLGCFAHAWYRGVDYCVPNDGSENTKRIFTLLRALLATNISAADLNATQTVRVTP
jgi:hypothetical protein